MGESHVSALVGRGCSGSRGRGGRRWPAWSERDGAGQASKRQSHGGCRVKLSRPETERGQSPEQRAAVRLRTPRVWGVTEPDGQVNYLQSVERKSKTARYLPARGGGRAEEQEGSATGEDSGRGRRGSPARKPAHVLAPRLAPRPAPEAKARTDEGGRPAREGKPARTLRKERTLGLCCRTY